MSKNGNAAAGVTGGASSAQTAHDFVMSGAVGAAVALTTVTYLFGFDDVEKFDSVDALERLLLVNARLNIKSGQLTLSGDAVAGWLAEMRAPGWFCVQLTSIDSLSTQFQHAQRVVRKALESATHTEVLRDDIGSHRAALAYPKLHEVENLMRELIATFMLTKLGTTWPTAAVPPKLKERRASNAAKTSEKRSAGFLHDLDFIELSHVLFHPYSTAPEGHLEAAVRAATSAEDFERAKELLPASNWERYFRQVVDVGDAEVKEQWGRLYDLRNKVAHNRHLTETDAESIENLTREMKGVLQKALEKLSAVSVPAAETQGVMEVVARQTNPAFDHFVSRWDALQAALQLHVFGYESGMSGLALHLLGALSAEDAPEFDRILQLRHADPALFHDEFPIDWIDQFIEELSDDSFSLGLLALDDQARWDAVGEQIDEQSDGLIDSEEFSSAMADTNASGWRIHDIVVTSLNIALDEECVAAFTFSASGDQDEERMYSGTTITGEATARIDEDGNVVFENIRADVEYGEPDEE